MRAALIARVGMGMALSLGLAVPLKSALAYENPYAFVQDAQKSAPTTSQISTNDEEKPSAQSSNQEEKSSSTPQDSGTQTQNPTASSSPSTNPTTPAVPGKKASSKKKQSRKNTQPAKPSSSDQAENSSKVVIKNGGVRDPKVQISPSLSDQQVSQQRHDTQQLLLTSDNNLKKISGRTLNPTQKEMLDQIHNYMDQARAADKAGNLQGAQTLASKARQLSDELVRH